MIPPIEITSEPSIIFTLDDLKDYLTKRADEDRLKIKGKILDWYPRVLFATKHELHSLDVSPFYRQGPEGKECLLKTQLPLLADLLEPQMLGVLTSTWMVTTPPGSKEANKILEGLPPSKSVLRVETLIIGVCSFDDLNSLHLQFID